MRHRNRRDKKVVEADIDDDDYDTDDESSTTRTTFRSSSLFTSTATLPTITSSPRTNSSSRTITTPPILSTRTSTVVILTNVPSTVVIEASGVQHGATVTAAASTASLSVYDEVGETQGNDTEAEADQRGVSGASIAVGTLGGVALLISLIILLWKWRKQVFAKIIRRRNNRQGTDDEPHQPNNTPPNPTMQRRATHRSDDRIMNEVIAAVYSAESGVDNRSEKQDADPFNDTHRLVEEGQVPPPPPNPATKPNSKLNRSVSRWLSRHNSQMLNPMSARASMASTDGGLNALTADWVSDDGTVTDESFSFHPLPPPKNQQIDQHHNDIEPVSEDRSSDRKTLPAELISRPALFAPASQIAPTVASNRTWAHGIRENDVSSR